jgi:hypothetical protein
LVHGSANFPRKYPVGAICFMRLVSRDYEKGQAGVN